LLKERYGGSVTVLALDAPDLEDVLAAALVKGADRAIRITGAARGLATSHAAEILARVIDSELGVAPADLILSGVQAVDDLDGLLAPLIACQLGLPFLGTVVAVTVDQARSGVVATMEYPGGTRAEFDVTLPAVFGIRAAERPPRYVPIAKVREAEKWRRIESIPVPLPANVVEPAFDVLGMRKPPLSGRAEMLEGSVDEISTRLAEVLAGRDLI
jgi:electron transfer flavoprotein beta subunit